jgi:AcrR family transcriptional regulator
MEKRSAAQKASRRAPIRSGRPPKELAGEVEKRILNAARRVFLERGFDGASIEEIAETARSGKPTIYARFANKEALFADVVMRTILSRIEQLKADVPGSDTVEERLVNLAVAILQWILVTDHVGLMRLAVAEARRFPDLASSVGRMARERGTTVIAQLLSEVAKSDELRSLPAFTPEQLATIARFFLELIVLPLMIRALLGENLEMLHAEIGPHAARSVSFFLAGSRHAGIHWPQKRYVIWLASARRKACPRYECPARILQGQVTGSNLMERGAIHGPSQVGSIKQNKPRGKSNHAERKGRRRHRGCRRRWRHHGCGAR